MIGRLLAVVAALVCAGLGWELGAAAPAGAAVGSGVAAAGALPGGAIGAGGAADGAGRTRAPATGPWRWPVAPAPPVSVGFAPPPLPWQSGHRGVDLAVPAGTTVRAAGAGVVAFAARVGGKPVVVVDHGPVRTTYEPVEATVDVGDRVSAGTPIGRTVATGGHCGRTPACLHWGLLRGRTYLDPLRLLERRPVVLKPG